MDDLEARSVTPFYLRMARLNAMTCDSATLQVIRDAGLSLSPDDVVRLLRTDWRPRVMGAWYSLLHPSTARALSRSLETSVGDLTSPPLTTAAVVTLGQEALPALRAYLAADVDSGWGAHGFVAAAIEHVGGSLSGAVASDGDRRDLLGMLAVAETLRGRDIDHVTP